MTASVRERSRDAFRAELARAAVDLFVDHGYDGITVEELSQQLGISRATFFRYFGSKEDVIVVATEGSGVRHAEALLSAGDGSAWDLLRAAFEPAAITADREPGRLRERLRMISALPTLKARIAEKRASQIEEVAAALATRIEDPNAARVLTAAAYTGVDIAWERWANDEAAALRDVFDDVFASLASGGAPRR